MVDLHLLLYFIAALLLVVVFLVWRTSAATARLALLQRDSERLEREMRDALAQARREASEAARAQREEQTGTLAQIGQGLATQMASAAGVQSKHLDGFAQQLTLLAQTNDARFEAFRQAVDQRMQEQAAQQHAGREESGAVLKRFGDTLTQSLATLTEANERRIAELRQTVEQRLNDLRQGNEKKLEEMRLTVDEKLHRTLEQRLSESFKQVSDRLEQVHKGLGEMQSLAAGVGDLKRVLTNVKTRGTWGEIQLGALLEQVLTSEQYERNVVTRPGSRERVEFAIKLPGRDDKPMWLPIDCKFPLEDYQRLQEAQEAVDPVQLEAAAKALESRVRHEARTIADKYIDPPNTSDFALLYLPIEGLYAEVLRRPGLFDALQRDCRVTICGPTTLTAILNSLQMGFRTLAIEKRSSEVWEILGAVKSEFGKFGDVLARTRKKLEEATNSIGSAETRTRVIERKLRNVEALPDAEVAGLLEPAGFDFAAPAEVDSTSRS
jgi:DNA recombination protein RmuC